MTELQAVSAVGAPKKELSPEEIYRRSLEHMSDRQLAGHTRRKARRQTSNIDDTFAIILSTIFDNKNTHGERAFLR